MYCKPVVANMQINKDGNKRRFTDDQVKSLESMFSSEKRPESYTKSQIADQLGLDPRQVAVWFQNRRARCKSKQIESEYNILKAHYDTLTSRFESLEKENQSILTEVQRLRDLQESPKESTSNSEPATYSSSGESILKSQEMHIDWPEGYSHDKLLTRASSESFKYIHEEPDNPETFRMIGSADDFLATSQNCNNLETISLTEENCDSDWWQLWG